MEKVIGRRNFIEGKSSIQVEKKQLSFAEIREILRLLY